MTPLLTQCVISCVIKPPMTQLLTLCVISSVIRVKMTQLLTQTDVVSMAVEDQTLIRKTLITITTTPRFYNVISTVRFCNIKGIEK